MVDRVLPPQIGNAFGQGFDAAQRNRLADAANVRAENMLDLDRERFDWRQNVDQRNYDFQVEGRDYNREQARQRAAQAAANAARRRAAEATAAERQQDALELRWLRSLPEDQRTLAAAQVWSGEELAAARSPEGRLMLSDMALDAALVGYGEMPQQPEAPSYSVRELPDGSLAYVADEPGRGPAIPVQGGGAPAGGDMSEREEQIDRLVNIYGMDRRTAVGVADGALALRTDDYGRSAIVDMATGQERPVTTAQGPAPVNTARPADPGIDRGSLRGGTGAEGVLSNVVNTASDAFGAGLVAPSNEAAARTLRTLQTEAMTELATDVSGRPSNFLMEQFNSLAPTPSDITEGPDRAAGKAMETVEFLERTIARNTAILENPRAYPPNIVAEAQRKAGRLVDLRNRMYGVAVGLQAPQGQSPGRAGGDGGDSGNRRIRIRVNDDGEVIE